MTLQEIFNMAYRGLRAQGFEQAVTVTGGCRYRTPDGKRCAIGHCIPDELYNLSLEGAAADRVAEILGPDWPVDIDAVPWLNALQDCHDFSYTPKFMKEKLHAFAKNHDLTIPE